MRVSAIKGERASEREIGKESDLETGRGRERGNGREGDRERGFIDNQEVTEGR